MATGLHDSQFKNPVIRWVDQRLPVFTMLVSEYGVYPTPRNFNYLWNFGAIALFMLVTMIVSGVVLAMNYAASTGLAFDSVERIMRDVNHGWMIRYIHSNGASFFFVAVYIHMFRGLYYGSYKKPRELLWMFGVLIFLLMMATAFMGYVLPWGQMSFWGAKVITSLFSAVPMVGDSVTTWLWGGPSVDNPTLNRFYALHYLLPFVIFAVVFLHISALHITGSNNPAGIEPQGPQDTIPFHPYYTAKDTFGLVLFIMVYALFVFWMPDVLGHADNYTPANPLLTPPHIVPEWYFLPFYAILRVVTFDINFPVASNMWLAIPVAIGGLFTGAVLAFAAWALSPKNIRLIVAAIAFAAGFIGAHIGFYAAMNGLQFVSTLLKGEEGLQVMPDFKILMTFIEAKLGGVIAMFGAIAILFVLPWLDTHPVRSARFRPWFRFNVFLLVVAFLILGWVGANPPEAPYIYFGQVASIYYFAFFLIILPILSRKEKAKALPASISESVLGRNVVLGLLAMALLLPASGAMAAEGNTTLKHLDWPHSKWNGTYDRAAMQRGFQVYKEVCATCHGMRLLSYRNLTEIGFSEAEVKAIAREYMTPDLPDENGDIKDRPALPSDRFRSPFANDNAAKAANNGALPPDLSLIIKGRQGHEDYLYSLLTSYGEPPAEMKLMPGLYYNQAFPGHQIAMPPPLTDGQVTYADGTPASIDQMSRDVTQFLAWAGDPHMEERKRTGTKVMIFLAVFAGLLYAAKRKVWKDRH